MKRKAVALMSGGLDSILAVKVILDQGIPVTAIRFITHFGCDPVTSGSCGKDVEPLVKMWGHLGLDVKMCHLGQDYIDMVKKPKYGWGKNMNPCVDCRVMMLEWAREIMEEMDAAFLVTGEVLDQRPMSQTRERNTSPVTPVDDRDSQTMNFSYKLPIPKPKVDYLRWLPEFIPERLRKSELSPLPTLMSYTMSANRQESENWRRSL